MFLEKGLSFLNDLFSAQPRQQLGIFQSIMNDLVQVGIHYEFLSLALRYSPDALCEPSDEIEAVFHGDEELFRGDKDANGPSFGWTWAGGEKFQPFYACGDRAHLRRWGYIMWDHERLRKVPVCRTACSLPFVYGDTDTREWAIKEIHNEACLRESGETTSENAVSTHPPVVEQYLLPAIEAAAQDDYGNEAAGPWNPQQEDEIQKTVSTTSKPASQLEGVSVYLLSLPACTTYCTVLPKNP